jgi:hypothetical protein
MRTANRSRMCVRTNPQYTVGIDPDPDSDPDTDGNREHGTAHPVHFVDRHYLFTTPQHFRYELNQRIAYSWRVSRLGWSRATPTIYKNMKDDCIFYGLCPVRTGNVRRFLNLENTV